MGIKEFVNPCWLLMVEVELLYILMQYVFDVIIVHDIIISSLKSTRVGGKDK